jgi:hypothetical protein
MPLDHPPYFDAVWRLFSGQMFFRDFMIAQGFVPIFLQAGICYFTGIHWLSMCLHAAILNGLFCLVVFAILSRLGLARRYALLYGLLSGVIYYTPVGSIWPDNDATFFLTLMLLVFVRMASGDARRFPAGYAFVFPLFFLAYFSKQNPTAFGLLIILFFSLQRLACRDNRWRSFGMMLLGLLAAVAILLAVVQLGRMDPDLIRQYFIDISSNTAGSRLIVLAHRFNHLYLNAPYLLFYSYEFLRLLAIGSIFLFYCVLYHRAKSFQGWLPRPFAFAFMEGLILVVIGFSPVKGLVSRDYRLICFGVILAGAAVIFAGRVISIAQRATFRPGLSRGLSLIALSWVLVLINFLFIQTTNNQPEDGVGWFFLSLGIGHAGALSILNDLSSDERKKKIVSVLMASILVGTSLADGFRFNREVNATRMVHDLRYEAGKTPIPADPMPPELKFLVWVLPDFYKFSPQDLRQTVDFLKTKRENFYLFGDMSMLYVMTRKPSVSPSLSFYFDQCIPRPAKPEFKNYQEKVLRNFQKYDVGYIVLEGEQTWIKLRIEDFPIIDAEFRNNFHFLRNFGPFRIFIRNDLRSD